jgi:DNA primase
LTFKSKTKVLHPRNSKTDTLFNFDKIDNSKPVIIVEGIFDLPVVWELNKNCVALLGASLSKNQIAQLKTIQQLIIIPDNDEAGLNLISSLDEVLNIDFDIAFLPKEVKDPGEATKKIIEHALLNKINVVDYLKKEYFEQKLSW